MCKGKEIEVDQELDGGTTSFPGPLSITGPALTNKRKTVGFGNTSVMLVRNLPQSEIAFHDGITIANYCSSLL